MNTYTRIYYTAAVIAGIGWFLALSPHAFHTSVGVPLTTPHLVVMFGGAVLGILSLFVMALVAKKA
jgi:uncharacterized Tic20 family protein